MRNSIIGIFLLVILLSACNKREKYEELPENDPIRLRPSLDSNFIDYIDKKLSLSDCDSVYKIICTIKNNYDKSLFIPISEWAYYANKPIKPFFKNWDVKNGFINVVKFDIPNLKYNHDFYIDIPFGAINRYYSRFIKIAPNQYSIISINFPSKLHYKNDHSFQNALYESIDYTLSVEFPVLSENEINQIYSTSNDYIVGTNYEINLPEPRSNFQDYFNINTSNIFRGKINRDFMDNLKNHKIILEKQFKLEDIIKKRP